MSYTTRLIASVTTPGTTAITYFATDAAGNEETPRSLTVRVNGPAPVIRQTWPKLGPSQRIFRRAHAS
ncbi:MAG TPA: hypothetical protein VEQ58_19110 [Polyangiaceae bacterium]|nr:hypothetical protein [Polyangiaceae bacterium]